MSVAADAGGVEVRYRVTGMDCAAAAAGSEAAGAVSGVKTVKVSSASHVVSPTGLE